MLPSFNNNNNNNNNNSNSPKVIAAGRRRGGGSGSGSSGMLVLHIGHRYLFMIFVSILLVAATICIPASFSAPYTSCNSINSALLQQPPPPPPPPQQVVEVVQPCEKTTTENNSNNKNDDSAGSLLLDKEDNRPYFILHVGPQKTGTSSLQNTLCKEQIERKLWEDGYAFLGTCPQKRKWWDNMSLEYKKPNITRVKGRSRLFFHANNTHSDLPNLVPRLVEKLLDAHAHNRSVIVSDENLSFAGKHMVANIAAFVNPMFRVRVVVAYRRFYEWIASWHNQYYRPLDQSVTFNWSLTKGKGSALPFYNLDWMEGTSDIFGDVELLQQNPAQMVQLKYAQFFSDIKMMNLHDLPEPPPPRPAVSSVNNNSNTTTPPPPPPQNTKEKLDPAMHYFLCSILPSATGTCRDYEQGFIQDAGFTNPSTSQDCDLLAMAAYQHHHPITPTAHDISLIGNHTNNNHTTNNNDDGDDDDDEDDDDDDEVVESDDDEQEEEEANNNNNTNSSALARSAVGDAICRYNKEILQEQQQQQQGSSINHGDKRKALKDFSRECMSTSDLDRLLSLSLATEVNMFGPDAAKEWMEEHRSKFYASQSKLFCWLNTKQVFEDETWRAFLRRIIME